MRFALPVLSLAVLCGCPVACPSPEDRAAKERIFSLDDTAPVERAARESLDASALADDADARRRVLWMPAEEVHLRLGGFAAETDVSFAWRQGEEAVSLEERAVLEQAAGGDFRVAIENDRDLGMELRWIGDVSYVRSRQGVFRERRADRAGHERWREKSLGHLATLLELTRGRLRLVHAGDDTVDGRSAVRYRLGHGGDPDPAASPPEPPPWAEEPEYPEEGPDAALRHRLAPFEHGRVARLEGSLWVDAETATILRLDADLELQVPPPGDVVAGGPARLDLRLRRTLADIGADRIIDVPDHEPFDRRPRAVTDPLAWWEPYVAEREAGEVEAAEAPAATEEADVDTGPPPETESAELPEGEAD